MDDNCRSYRKYKNHFRLGGYHITLDGLLLNKRACLTKKYPKEKRDAMLRAVKNAGYSSDDLRKAIKLIAEE